MDKYIFAKDISFLLIAQTFAHNYRLIIVNIYIFIVLSHFKHLILTYEF